jgi:hypothetical protein
VQGYIFSRPVPAGEVKALLRQNPFGRLVEFEAPTVAAAH